MQKTIFFIFTLIELLIVIAIIVILTSILLPALKKARDKTREIACVNNYKQQGNSLAMYTNDYNSYYPSWGSDIVRATCWDAKIAPYLDIPGSLSDLTPNTPFQCPAMSLDPFTGYRSYAAHKGMCNPEGWSYCFFLTSQLPRKSFSDQALVYEVARDSMPFSGYTLFGKRGNCEYNKARTDGGQTVYRHNNATNILYADNHISRHNLSECSAANWWFQ